MRVLVSVRPYVGHLHPVLPVLEAVVAAGHQVVVATSEELAVVIEDRALGWHPAGVHPDRWLDEHPDADPNYGLEVVAAKLTDLVEAIDDVGADLVLADSTDLAALLAAPLTGRPLARFSVSHYLPIASWQRLAGPTLRALRVSNGMAPDPGLRSLRDIAHLDVMPPSMQHPKATELTQHHVVRFEPRDLDGLAPPPAPAGDPNVLVSFGTVFGDRDRLWRTVTAALAGLQVRSLDTRNEPRPLRRTLEVCDALVCHGGFNTVLSAISAGVPLVCIPMAGDQYFNAGVVERLGIGVRLSASRLTRAQVADAVTEVVNDPGYAARLAVVRDELESLTTPATAVGWLEGLVTAHSPSR